MEQRSSDACPFSREREQNGRDAGFWEGVWHIELGLWLGSSGGLCLHLFEKFADARWEITVVKLMARIERQEPFEALASFVLTSLEQVDDPDELQGPDALCGRRAGVVDDMLHQLEGFVVLEASEELATPLEGARFLSNGSCWNQGKKEPDDHDSRESPRPSWRC